MKIKKKIWPENFEKILHGKKKFEMRLADFNLKEGDVLILEEYDPKTQKYTGRNIKKKVNFVTKLNPSEYDPKDVVKFGLYVIQLGE